MPQGRCICFVLIVGKKDVGFTRMKESRAVCANEIIIKQETAILPRGIVKRLKPQSPTALLFSMSSLFCSLSALSAASCALAASSMSVACACLACSICLRQSASSPLLLASSSCWARSS